MIKHVKADIFTTDCDIIVHQVNCYGVMGAGIAKQVKERYPDFMTFINHYAITLCQKFY